MTSSATDDGHLGLTLQDLLDDRLAGAERARAQRHLETCAPCRSTLEHLRQVKSALQSHAARQAVPADLRAVVTQALNREDLQAQAAQPRKQRLLKPRWALGFGLAATVAVATVLLWSARTPARLPGAVAQDFAEFQAGRLALELRTTAPRELEHLFASHPKGLATAVYDLAMMGYPLAGGRVHRLQGRPTTLAAYEGPDGSKVLCEMYEGALNELPAAAETVTHGGIDFRVYRQQGITAVFWQEGKVICVLISDMASDRLLKLAIAKATPAAPLSTS